MAGASAGGSGEHLGVPARTPMVRATSSRSPAVPRYQIEDFEVVGSPLGGGSYGQVSKVVHKKTREVFAMKVVPAQKILEHDMSEYLKREVTTQFLIRHPNVLQLYYYFEDEDSIQILLEYASGGSLFGVLRQRGPLPQPDAARYFAHVAGALDHLHKKGIVHRDLKPENILMCDGDVAKVADFGWCGELDDDHQRKTFCGTWDYLSPEMVKSEPHDHNVDVWAMGVLLYEMLTHKPPFAARTQMQALQRITKADLDFPDFYPEAARDLTLQLLRAEPADRLPLSAAFEHAFLAQFGCRPALAVAVAGTASSRRGSRGSSAAPTPHSSPGRAHSPAAGSTRSDASPLGSAASAGASPAGSAEDSQRMLWQGLMQHVRGCWVDEQGDFYGGARIEFSDDGWRPLNPRASAHKRSAYAWKVRAQKCILTETRRDGSRCQFELAPGRDGRLVVRHADQKMQWNLRRVVVTSVVDSPKTAVESLLCAGLSASGHQPSAKPSWSDVASCADDVPCSEAGDDDFGVPRCRCGIALMPGKVSCSQCSREANGTAREEQSQHLSIWPWESKRQGGDAGSAGSLCGGSPARSSAGPVRSGHDARGLPERGDAGAARCSSSAGADLEGTRRVVRPAPEPPCAAAALPAPTASLLQALRASSPSRDDRWQQEQAEARRQAMFRQARLQQEKAELLMRSQRIDKELQDIHVCVRE